jgi:hypothetical protein
VKGATEKFFFYLDTLNDRCEVNFKTFRTNNSAARQKTISKQSEIEGEKTHCIGKFVKEYAIV